MYPVLAPGSKTAQVPSPTDPGEAKKGEPACDDAATARELARQAHAAWAQGDRAAARAMADVARVYACLAERPDHTAARLDLAAAQLRADIARAEAVAEAADDYARLTPRQRSARRVARMLQAAQPDTPVDKIDHEAVPLTTVTERLNVSQSTACEIRKEAAALLLSGYSHRDAGADAAYETGEPRTPAVFPDSELGAHSTSTEKT
ncbi:hypothetical protein ACGF8B_39360 [Streptomyces sp. NPDC047917]|uniref:hypothetical protein n=1 Tax=Streptomyces sp. NPDC047917 TaxID=3365491 RepID=UPI00371DEC8B